MTISAAKTLPHIVTAYALAVVAGDIVAGRLVIRACERHLHDLERSRDPECPIYFDEEAANRALRFFRNLKQSKGKWRKKKLRLIAWQKFVVGSIFGWKWRATGKRRFRTAYEEVARKNGKTTKLAAFGLYGLVADKEGAPEVYAAATKRDQAKILFAEAARMVRQSAPLKRLIKIRRADLYCAANDGVLVPLGADADTVDGLNPSMNLVDELHAHKKRDLWDVLDTAVGAREQPLQFAITTAGFSSQSNTVCREQHDYSVSVLEGFDKPGGVQDDTWFAYIATIDPEDDWRDPDVWIKANPSLGHTIQMDDLHRMCEQAKAVPSKQNAFKRLRLNIWTEQAEIWIDLARWDRCGAPFDPVKLQGRRCYGGLDLSSWLDLSAFVLVFPPTEEDPCWYVVPHFFMPGDRLEYRERTMDKCEFRRWAEEGFLELTPGDYIDHRRIRDVILEASQNYDLVDVGFDPWGSQGIVTDLMDEGIDMVEIRQGIRSYSEPSKEFEALYYSGRLAHGDHPVLRWNAKNVAIRHDENENYMPAKKKSSDRIDGIASTIMAISRAVDPDQVGPSVYEERGVIVV